ncbi:hypothetical protein PanWU01x14_210000 [Parasponia andersonii]|uniref:Uncharacterized protein n=1 Tax=Parasponia andersonii TaxID=3476 RepID=A0A2P5BUB8_PARAD|nr:hypothetical protein PanWU01x14_210000 [Parasponia andersonii]
MALFSSFFNCFHVPSSSSSRVSDHVECSELKVEKSKSSRSKSKSSKAPVVVSYFPVNSHLSRL